MTTFVCINFRASNQIPLISTSSQRQQKTVKRAISKQKSVSIQELGKTGLHREWKSDLLTKMFDFFLNPWIRKKTNS